MGPSSDGQPGATGLTARSAFAHRLLTQDIENALAWMSGCMDDSAHSCISALILRVFFVTSLFSVLEVVMPTKLELLLEKEAQLKAQIQLAKAAERTLEKKRDTRRKILIGAAVLAKVERGEWPKQDLNLMMDGFLTRPHERALFDLEGGSNAADAGSMHKAKAELGGKPAAGKKTVTAKKTVVPLPEPAGAFDDDFDL
jgi:hypothetical protein